MKRQHLASLMAVFLLALFSNAALAASGGKEDSDTRFVEAKVVEVNTKHISVIARTGVEHVIAIDDTTTKVKRGDKLVALKSLKEGDVVTVELDELSPLKLARNIEIAAPSNSAELASNEP